MVEVAIDSVLCDRKSPVEIFHRAFVQIMVQVFFIKQTLQFRPQ